MTNTTDTKARAERLQRERMIADVNAALNKNLQQLNIWRVADKPVAPLVFRKRDVELQQRFQQHYR
jgi:hypothetical protein